MLRLLVASADPWEVRLNSWQEAGPLKPTAARVACLFTMAEGLIRRSLGQLVLEDFVYVRERLKAFLGFND